MPIDAGIYANLLRGPKSVEEYDNEANAARTNALQLQQQGLQVNALAQQQKDDQALRNYLSGNVKLDTPEGQAGLYRVAPKAAGGILKSQAEIAQANAAAKKDAEQGGKAAQEKVGEAMKNSRYNLEGVTTPEQYIAWHEQNHKDPVLGPYLASRGVTVDQARARISEMLQKPGGFEQLVNESKLGAEKAYDHAMKQQEFGLKQNQFGETVRHNKSAEGIQVRGQNMADARARDGNTLKAAEIQAGGKPPPGYRWNSDGTLEAIPGGPGDKLPESQQKQVVGTQNLSNAIREYRDSLRSFGILDALKPDQRAMMGTKYNNMMLQAKEAYNLGVLNGPDFDILQSVVTDPRSLKGAITSNKALDTQASELDRIMSGVAQTSSQLKPRGSGSPSSQAPTSGPKPGAVEDGHRFKGGDPSKPSNWEKVK